MWAACRARSTSSTPQVNGSSKERRKATLTPPSTIEARRISTPPFSSASGGTERASNLGLAMLVSVPPHQRSTRDDLTISCDRLSGGACPRQVKATFNRTSGSLTPLDRVRKSCAQRRIALRRDRRSDLGFGRFRFGHGRDQGSRKRSPHLQLQLLTRPEQPSPRGPCPVACRVVYHSLTLRAANRLSGSRRLWPLERRQPRSVKQVF